MNTLTLLDTQISNCERCALRKSCNQPVAGISIGGATRLLFIGEYPEIGEDIEGEAFVDRAGYNFKQLVEQAKIKNYRLTYTVKCKPGVANLIETGVASCKSWLFEEINIIKPKIICTLGKLPLRILLDEKKSIRLEDFIGRTIPLGYTEAKLQPWYSTNYILNRGKKMREQTISLLETIYGILE